MNNRSVSWRVDSLRIRIGLLLSKIGETIKCDKLVYNSLLYYHFDRIANYIAPALVNSLIVAGIRPGSVVDYGAGSGRYVAEFRSRGTPAIGFEYSDKARTFAKKQNEVELEAFDLSRSERQFHLADLAMSLEVAEHVPQALAVRLVQVCMDSSPIVLFSAARPGQSGQGHINCRPFEDWCALFSQGGYSLDKAATNSIRMSLQTNLRYGRWIIENIGVYRRTVANSG